MVPKKAEGRAEPPEPLGLRLHGSALGIEEEPCPARFPFGYEKPNDSQSFGGGVAHLIAPPSSVSAFSSAGHAAGAGAPSVTLATQSAT